MTCDRWFSISSLSDKYLVFFRIEKNIRPRVERESMADEPEDGRRRVSDKAILQVVTDLEPKATTPRIAEMIGMTPQGAGYRLRQLEGEGEVSSDMIGRSKLWTIED